MINVEPSFVLYALLLDPGCCLRAHIILIELVEPEGEKKGIPPATPALYHANAPVLTKQAKGGYLGEVELKSVFHNAQ